MRRPWTKPIVNPAPNIARTAIHHSRPAVDRQYGVLQQGAKNADESDLGADGKVDVARNDDQNHAA